MRKMLVTRQGSVNGDTAVERDNTGNTSNNRTSLRLTSRNKQVKQQQKVHCVRQL